MHKSVLLVALAAVSFAGGAFAQTCEDPWLLGAPFPHSANGMSAAVAWDPDGAGPEPERLVASGFSSISTCPDCQYAAMWDGSAWRAMPNATVPIRALAVVNGDLLGDHLIWNGVSWTKYDSDTFYIASIGPWNGRPVAAMTFSISDPTLSIRRWNGTDWVTLGTTNATKDKFLSIFEFGGNLIVAGEFTSIGGQSIRGIAKYDGVAWSALGAGVASGTVTCASVVAGDLYVGGSFNLTSPASACSVAKWNGVQWSKYGPTGITPIGIAGAAGVPIMLLWGCAGDGCSSTADVVFSLQSGAWKAVASDGPKGDVRAIVSIGAGVAVVGKFVSTAIMPDLSANADVGILHNQKWMSIATGFNGPLSAVRKFGNDLVAAGAFMQAPGVSAARVARWNGQTWSAMGNGFDKTVDALAVFNGELYAGGAFTKTGTANLPNMAKWNGSAWVVVGIGGFDGEVMQLAAGEDRLYAYGNFKHAGGATVNGMAQFVGGQWYSVGDRLSGGGRMVAHQGSLYTSGGVVVNGNTINAVTRWNGTAWSSISTQATGSISDLYSDGTNLWIAGAFKISPADPNSTIARWNGSTWQSFVTPTVGGSFVEMNGELYLADAQSIVKWSGTQWMTVATHPTAAGSGFVTDSEIFGGELILVGGTSINLGISSTTGPLFDRWSPTGVPEFLSQPLPQVIAPGQTAAMSVSIVDGYKAFGSLSFSWRRNGVPIGDGAGGASAGGGVISGSANSSLSIAGAQQSDSGFYDCLVIAACDTKASDAARLQVGAPCSADFNNDGLVDDADFSIFVIAYDVLACDAPEMPAGCPADMNGDGVVEDADFSLFVVKYDELICP